MASLHTNKMCYPLAKVNFESMYSLCRLPNLRRTKLGLMLDFHYFFICELVDKMERLYCKAVTNYMIISYCSTV